jgi:hypothetical protein
MWRAQFDQGESIFDEVDLLGQFLKFAQGLAFTRTEDTVNNGCH